MARATTIGKRATTIASIILLCAVVVYIAYDSIWARQWESNNFAVQNATEIVRVKLECPGSEPLVLQKRDGNKWFVNNGLAANEISVRDLLEVVSMVSIKAPVSRLEQHDVNQELDQSGTLVTIYKRKPLVNVFNVFSLFKTTREVRKYHVWGQNYDDHTTYMRMMGYATPFEVHVPGSSFPFSTFFNPSLTYWQNPVVVDLKAAEIGFVQVSFKAPEPHTYRLENHNGHFVLEVDGKTIATDSISRVNITRFVTSFSDLYYEARLTGNDSIEAINKMATTSFMDLEVGSTRGKKYTLGFYSKTTDDGNPHPDIFFLIVDNNVLSIARYFVFNRIMKPSNYFIN